MFVLWSVNLLFLISAESTETLEMMSGSRESAGLSVEVCVKSSWRLEVRWAENQQAAEQTYQIQITQGDHFNLVNQSNVRKEAGVGLMVWSWTSALPLQCDDHSVRIRRVPGPWSDWTTHYEFQVELDRKEDLQGGGQQNVRSNRSRLFPTQEVLQEGSSVFLCCIPPDGARVSSLRFSNTPYPLMDISPRVRAIRVLGLNTTTMGVNFICLDDSGSRRAVVNYVTFPPEKPKNLSCETRNLRNVVCSWTPGRAPNLSSVRRRRYTLHMLNSDGLMFSCDERSSTCQFPVLPHLIFYNISVVVKNSLGEERESYTFNITHRVFPVLEHMAVVPGSLNAEVFWTLDGNFTNLQIICQINMEPINTTTELQCVGVECVRNLSVCVQQLKPSSQYSTRGRCAVQHNNWSSWSTTHTFSTEALLVLDIWRWMEEDDESQRMVRVLWKSFSSSSHSIVEVYEVCVQQQDESSVCVNVTETQVNVTVGVGVCNVTVRAFTHTGLSVPSSLTLSALNTAPITKQKRIVGNADGFLLVWSGLSSATCGYTLDWCMMGNVGACDLQWRKVSANQTSLLLRKSGFKVGCRYTFNIYSCHPDGHQIHETHTGYLEEQKPLQAPHVSSSPNVSTHSITVEWSFDEENPTHPGFITGYTLTAHTEPDNTHGVFSVTVDDPQCKIGTVEGLCESQRFTLHLAACTKAGCGPASVFTVTTLPKYHTRVLKVVTPVLLLIGCCWFLCSSRNTVRGIIMDVFIFPKRHNMKMMELDDDVYKVSKQIGTLEVEECESCDVEIIDQEIHPHSFFSPDSDHEEFMTATNLTYLLLSNTPEHAKHCGSSSSGSVIYTSTH